MCNRALTVSLLGVFILTLAACSTPPKIQYDSVQGYDFS